MRAPAIMAVTLLSVCCGNRSSVAWPDTRMSTTPSGSATIPRCVGSSAGKRPLDARRRQARCRFETRWLTAETNLSALGDLSGQWIDRVHARRPPRGVVLDMDSSVSPTHGDQENSVWNGHYACTCCHPLFVFNQFGDLERGWVFLRIAVLASSIVMWVRPRDAASEQFRKCYRLRQLGLIRGIIRGIPA
jgi:hypothetical protein